MISAIFLFKKLSSLKKTIEICHQLFQYSHKEISSEWVVCMQPPNIVFLFRNFTNLFLYLVKCLNDSIIHFFSKGKFFFFHSRKIQSFKNLILDEFKDKAKCFVDTLCKFSHSMNLKKRQTIKYSVKS